MKTKKWFTYFLGISFLLGIVLRVIWVNDMEYKEDEQYNFNQSQWIGNSLPWPWYGIPSGVYVVNPGMSIWVFAILAKLFGIHEPTALATALQLFALLGMSLVIPFTLKWVEKEDRTTWFWAFALAMVNPFLILYQRKLWPEPFLPVFTMLTLMGWWTRDKRLGAWIWGMIGAWLGQIHMSGFFFSAGLAFWTFAFKGSNTDNRKANWIFWFFGSCVGALPLLPWLIYILQHPTRETISAGWTEISQLKYWTFWLTDPTGLHLGNPLGILRGNSHWAQISDFVRYPLLPSGSPTYIVGIAHVMALMSSIWILLRGVVSLRKVTSVKTLLIGKSSNTAFLQNSAFLGCGILLTATGVMIRRYYMAVTFPLEFIFLIRMADPKRLSGQRLLIVLWIAELVMSAGFVHYIHVKEGSAQGDYGPAYHVNFGHGK